ncbi:hypothetical protein FRC12_020411 [Ceratobasidium sp. 428]|nr:hypothetical protein FRC12_020411 [Ceratobasidium sp. 428]
MLYSGNKREADKDKATKCRLTKERNARSRSAHSGRSSTFEEATRAITPESQPNPNPGPGPDTDPNTNLDSQYTWWERPVTREEIINAIQEYHDYDLSALSDSDLANVYNEFWQDERVREFVKQNATQTGAEPPPAQQPEAEADMDLDPHKEYEKMLLAQPDPLLSKSQRRRRRRSKSKQTSPTPPSASMPDASRAPAGANNLMSPTPAPVSAPVRPPAPAPASASGQTQGVQAPIAPTHADSAGLGVDGTATQPSSDDENGPPPIKRSRTHQLPVTALSQPSSNAASKHESENALPPRDTLQLRYPSHPRQPSSRPRPRPRLPTTQPSPPATQPSPPASQPRLPTSQPRQTSEPFEEEVPETDAEILAERAPRTQPVTYSGARSHVRSNLYPIDPKTAALHDYSSWRESVRARPPLNLSAGSSNRPVASTSNLPQSDQTRRKADLVAKRDAAKATLNEMVNPSDPVKDAQRDMLRDGHRRLKAMASTVVGREERKKKPLPSRARAGGSSGQAATNAWAHRGDRDDDEDEDGEEQDDENEDDENEDENARHDERILVKNGRARKPVTNDLKGRSRAAATIAKLLLYLYVVVFGPYLERETYLLWSELVYEIAWYYVYPKLPFEKPLEIVYAIMVNNLASFKCNAKLIGRTIVEPIFGLLRSAMTRADIDHNLDILRYIYPLRFHCTNPRGRRGHYESLIIPRAIAAILFYGESSVGMLFHEYLDPIPTITLAYILTVVSIYSQCWDNSVDPYI